ncbi:MAG: tetratricopeptide repeat protein [Microcystis panniformis]
MGRYEAALPLYQLALDIYQTALGADHPHTQACQCNLLRLQECLND